ncbi:MAG: NAD(P)-dependent oxidoreductase [Caulobacter sp.]
MTVLVTGVTGLVGARLLPRLVGAGIDCRALIRPEREAPAGVTAVIGDLADRASLEQAVNGVSSIVHLAAVFRTQDEDLIWRSNLEGARNLIAAARAAAPAARIILASTSHVYGAQGARPGREGDLVAPQHAYPASKVAAEEALCQSDLNWSILRLPFIYGDGDGHLEALPRHAQEARMHAAKRISTLHHRDIATAIQLALTGVFDKRIVNLADDAPTSIFELIQLVGGTMQESCEPLDNPWHLHVDASLSRRLGFQPTIRTVYQAAQEGLL